MSLNTNKVSLAPIVVLLFVLSWLSGCAGTPQTKQLLDQPPPELAKAVELSEVPFYAQEAYQCGPASLAMVLKHQGLAVTPAELTPKLYVPEKRGTLQIELLSNTRQHGLIPYQLAPTLEDLFKEVQAGHPVLVFQNLGLDWYPKWHYAVVVGYDLDAQHVLLRSGTEERHVNALGVFERTWARADHWAIVTLQPGELPATAEYWRYLKAVAAMEEVRKFGAAVAGYQAGLKKWPDDKRLLMGLGNSHYARGELSAAAKALQQLVSTHPSYAPAYNNLAQIKAEQGLMEEAQRHAERAVALGGDHLTTYRQTLREIKAQRLNR